MKPGANGGGNFLEIYQRRRTELLSVARRQQEVLAGLGDDTALPDGNRPSQTIAELIRRLESDRFRVLVVGRFSAGKSTLLNALLGATILPASPTPTTGVLCDIRYADEQHKKATLFPKPGMGPDGRSEPFDIKISDLKKELEHYVKIDHFGDDSQTSRYQRAEIYWPLEMCRNGVDIIDTVGLDDPDSRDEVTLRQASSADAILYCMKSQDAYSAKDKQVLGMLQSLGYTSLFFLITYWDHIRAAAAMGEMTEQEFMAVQWRNLTPWTELGKNGIKFVDSKSALLARMAGDAPRLDQSGIAEVEEALYRFLSEEKGRAKLLTSLRCLRALSRTVRTVIPSRIGLWQTSAAELERRYKEAEQPLRTLEATRQAMVSSVAITIRDIATEARDMAERYFLGLPDLVKTWAEAYEIQGSVGFPPTKNNITPVVEEVAGHLKEKMQEDVGRWTTSTLYPMVAARKERMEESLEEHARNFMGRLEEIRLQIAVGVDGSGVTKQQEISVLGRVIAGTYIALTGDFLTGGLGLTMGLKAMATTIALQVAAGVLLAIFNLLNPVAIILATVAAILSGAFLNTLSLKNNIKKMVGEKICEEIVARRGEFAKAVQDKVTEELTKIERALDAGLAGEIASVRNDVEAILRAQQEGRVDAEREVSKLKDLERTNMKVDEDLESLIFEAGLPK
ncbi:MAG TPA: dynamin family protein [Thermoanaerobaculia bacterium]|jgi:GTPase Era involved in 16S rRNA processing